MLQLDPAHPGPSRITELFVVTQPLTDVLWSVWIQMLRLILGRPLSLGSQPLPDPLQTYLDPGSTTHPNITRDCLLVLVTQPLIDLSLSIRI